jgi:PUA domain protein
MVALVECRFTPSSDVSGHTPVKSSVQRSIRSSVLSQWKIEPETLEAIWPKKEGLVLVKWSVSHGMIRRGTEDANPFNLFFAHSRDHISIYTVKQEPLFFQHFEEAFFPTLRLLHKCAFVGGSQASEEHVLIYFFLLVSC